MRVPLAVAVALVALAGGCVQPEPGPAAEGPTLAFDARSTTGRATVVAAEGGLSWHLLKLVALDCGPEGQAVVVRMGDRAPYQNDRASSSGAPLNHPDHRGFCADAIPTPIGQGVAFVVAGDFLEFCTTGQGLTRGAHDVSLRIVEDGSDRVVGRVFFTEPIPVCPA